MYQKIIYRYPGIFLTNSANYLFVTRLTFPRQNSTQAFSPSFDLPQTVESIVESTNQPRFEESFTIHLGTQLKQMYNIRLMACNVIDLCTYCETSSGYALNVTLPEDVTCVL